MTAPIEAVFIPNGVRYIPVVGQRGRRPRGAPVPCVDMEASRRPLRYYPATKAEVNQDGEVVTRSAFGRLLVEDRLTKRTLPLRIGHPGDAHMVAERYAAALVDRDPERRLDATNWVAVSTWALELASRFPGRVTAIPEWLISQEQADRQAEAAAAVTAWTTQTGQAKPRDQH